jgi:hypothetical protein
VDSETAKVVLAGITALAVVVWLSGLRFLRSSAHRSPPREGLAVGEPEDAGSTGGTILSGSAEVEGQPASLASRAAGLLAREALFPGVPLKVVEKSDRHVRFERVEAGGPVQAAGRWLRRGQLSFDALGGGRTRVEWAVELADPPWLLRLGMLFQAAGLIAIVVGCWAILTYVVPSPDPAIRWQTVQMVQVSHLLWPPFLFGALHRQGRKQVAGRMEALAHNLPHLENV